ncbi:MAG: nitronate monooxygenase family protein [Sulfuricella sp.]|jgi:nitronate monooxygenase|nr:nitronate monooxygenase family protein [Sulfuricella sp.]
MIRIDLPLLRLKDKALLPIVQGGMGVGVSAHGLAGAVAGEGAIGTIASIDLRRHHPDLMERSTHPKTREAMDQANLAALDREIKGAKQIANGNGMVAVNVMKAVTEHPQLVRQACESGTDAIVMGAGLPFDLPEMTHDFPAVALIPILSDVRGINVVLKKWMRKNRLPDAIVIEHPRYAGGHLGAPKPDDIMDARFDFPGVLEGVFKLFREFGIERERIPLIPAGGINSFDKVRNLLRLGASAVQVGTPFAVTVEGDAHPNFKKVLVEAKPEDIVTFMSAAGLPARAVLTPWLKNYMRREFKLMRYANPARSKCAAVLDCLSDCGLRDGIAKMGQFCIDSQLAAALRGDIDKGLFFRGSESLPFGEAIRSVRELLEYLLTGRKPAMACTSSAA